MKPKLLYYVPSLGIGGAETVNATYINHLSVLYDLTLVVDDYISNEEHRFENVEVIYIKGRFVSKVSQFSKSTNNLPLKISLSLFRVILDYCFYPFLLRRIFKGRTFDVIIYGYHFLPPHLLEIFKFSKSILFIHNSLDSLVYGYRKYLIKSTISNIGRFSHLVFVSNEARSEYSKCYSLKIGQKAHTIYNPCDVNEIGYLSKTDKEAPFDFKYIVSCGRISEANKDFTTLIMAFIASASYHDLHLVIIGDGSSLHSLKKIVNDSNVSTRIHFTGFLSNPFPYIRRAEALILSSKSEGFGMVIVEAMTLKVPVISSNCPVGPSEILQNGRLGTLFEVGDSKTLSSIIYNLAFDYTSYHNKVNAAYLSTSRFDVSTCIQRLEKIIND